MTLEEWKLQTRYHMEIFLRSRGWPWALSTRDRANEEVLRLCRELFLSLDRVGLIPQGFTYEQFYRSAWQEYLKAKSSSC